MLAQVVNLVGQLVAVSTVGHWVTGLKNKIV